jgi:hypothetical protein
MCEALLLPCAVPLNAYEARGYQRVDDSRARHLVHSRGLVFRAASVLNQRLPIQKSIGISELLRLSSFAPEYKKLVVCLGEVVRGTGPAA